MAKATFTIADTPAARTELSLLLQIESSQLDKISHNGLLTVEFADLLEDKAMHVLSGAVANHGFYDHSTTLKKAQIDQTTTIAVDSKTIARIPATSKPKGTKE